MLKHALALGLCVGALLASAPSYASAPGLDLSKLAQTAQADLAAAKADADAHGDRIASQCYAGIETYVATNPSAGLPSLSGINGVASAFQTARDTVKGVQSVAAGGPLPTDLIIACGPLALDVQNDLGKAAAGGFTLFGLHL